MNDIQQAKCNQLAEFLRRRTDVIPRVPGSRYGLGAPLITVEQLATNLLVDTEWQSLRLGTWLGTTDGQIISNAVAIVIPPTYRPEYNLVVDGLKLAAQLQAQGKQKVAGIVVILVAGVGLAAYWSKASAA
jgi:hypothetical protein